MTVTISFANQKGGVGKTTSSVTLAHGLARMGQRVLLVDLDGQGHVAKSLGLAKENGLYRLLINAETLEGVQKFAREGLAVILGDKSTDQVEEALSKQKNGLNTFVKYAQQASKVDVLIFDTPPSLRLLQAAAITAADVLVVPVVMEALAVDGLKELLITLAQIKEKRRQAARFGTFILPTMFERTTSLPVQTLRELAETYGRQVWPPIPKDARLREASAAGQTIWEYAPRCPAVRYMMNRHLVGGYHVIVERLMEILT